MPDSVMSLFPHLLTNIEAMKIPMRTCLSCTDFQMRSIATGFDLFQNSCSYFRKTSRQFQRMLPFVGRAGMSDLMEAYLEGPQQLLNELKDRIMDSIMHFRQARAGELEFLELFSGQPAEQDWTVEYDDTHVILDLPGFRLIDISTAHDHIIGNYAVVFAPRAGHHSNIAERVALFLRDHGLSRMAVVEQKCAEDIPLHVNGRRHYEDFAGQLSQYRRILMHLKNLTGHAPHLIAVCQPGPLLMTALIMNPELGRTFGSAGAPMHTEAEDGFLTGFARMAGPHFIDIFLALFGRRVGEDRPGAGRDSFDGRLQVLGFYLMGFQQHLNNFNMLLKDLKNGNQAAADRQKAFYQWYNTVHHLPAGFIRDTYKNIFIENALIRGSLRIGDRTVAVADYPDSVPIWALGGTKDDIAPPLQATGHMDLMNTVSPAKKLPLLCDAGHMGLFRSRRILERYYTRIAEFLLKHSEFNESRI